VGYSKLCCTVSGTLCIVRVAPKREPLYNKESFLIGGPERIISLIQYHVGRTGDWDECSSAMCRRTGSIFESSCPLSSIV